MHVANMTLRIPPVAAYYLQPIRRELIMSNGCVKSVTAESFEDEVLQHTGVVLVDFTRRGVRPAGR